MAHKSNKSGQLRLVLIIYTLVFFVWGVYRYLFPMNVWLEETVLKFVVFGLPVFWVVLVKERKGLESVGMTTDNLLRSTIFGLLFGLWLAVMVSVLQFISQGSWGINPAVTRIDLRDTIILGLFTALWQQLLFAGFMLPRLVKHFSSEPVASMMVAIMFVWLHLPLQLVLEVPLAQLLIRSVLLFGLSFGANVLMLRYKNLAAPIYAHAAWGSVVYLFG